eukprot:6191873-Pleurochrysis_carterae.AAC.1
MLTVRLAGAAARACACWCVRGSWPPPIRVCVNANQHISARMSVCIVPVSLSLCRAVAVCQECDRQAVLRPLAAVVPASSHSRAKHRMEQSGSQAEGAAQGSRAGVRAEAAASIAAVSADQGGCAGDHPAPGGGGGDGGESTRTMRDAWRIDSGTAAVETSALDEPSETASSLAPTLLLPATMELLGTEHLQRTVELSQTIELQHAVAPAVADSRASARASESAEARLRLRDSCQRDDGGAT